MAKVSIDFPARPADFCTQLQVRVTDINYGNHLANDKLVAMLHEARVLLLQSLGYSEFDIEGRSLIQADLMVRYKGEGFQGDKLEVETFIENITSRSFDLLYRISTLRKEQEVAIAHAKIGLVFYDYQARSIASTPELFVSKVKNLLHEKLGA